MAVKSPMKEAGNGHGCYTGLDFVLQKVGICHAGSQPKDNLVLENTHTPYPFIWKSCPVCEEKETE